LKRLLIISHVRHYRFQGSLYAYGPYAREIEMWADLFPEVRVAAPCREDTPPGDCLALHRPGITMVPVRETGGATIRARLHQLSALPEVVWTLCRAMRAVDAIHVRCPGNLGLLGVILAPLFSRRLIAKYAGQWSSYPGEAFSARLQRALLRSPWWRGPVTVYASGAKGRTKIVPFFTSILTAEQMSRARRAAAGRKLHDPVRVLYVGRLARQKNVHVLLHALESLKRQGLPAECAIVGDGPQHGSLRELCAQLALEDRVLFAGAVGFHKVLDFYQSFDVLVLASETEGWPKAIAEAMAFGLVCIGSNRGLVPHMLAEGRGFTVPPGDALALAAALGKIVRAPKDYAPMSARAAAWGQTHSLETLREAVRELLNAQWSTALTAAVRTSARRSEAAP
jgi:glycosyltransferase involved in cell wall biosynthesis